jgi:peptidyl-prolyl cis-trans isomerase SDCCAG10
MSNVYVTEPPTRGKVVLHTSLGDVDIELWAKECPKTVRNFIQLCLEGYYDNTNFFRVVPGFLVQAGDPTGTGLGGTSIYPEGSFDDEFHSRLRFNRRGLLGMATTRPGNNTSQFFFTLGKADELTKKNTLFGRVVGDTVFNVLKMGEVDLQGEEPVHPIILKSATVLHNPFDDIVPRTNREERLAEEASKLVVPEKLVQPVKRNTALLSFQDDDMELPVPKKKKSSDLNQQPQSQKLEKTQTEKTGRQVDRPTIHTMKKTKLDAINSEIANLTASLKKPQAVPEKVPIPVVKAKSNKFDASEFLASQREKFATKKTVKKDDDILDRLNSFSQRLKKETVKETVKEQGTPCLLHNRPDCLTCKQVEPETEYGDKKDESDFLAHALRFPPEVGNLYSLDDYLVLDPRTSVSHDKKLISDQRKK